MKNLLIITVLLSALTAVSVFASDYEDGYEEGYEDAQKKYAGFDLPSAVGGFILGFGFYEMFISKDDE